MVSCVALLVSAAFVASASGFLLDPPSVAKPVWHLTYFDLRGRGEISRLVFAAGKRNYTETRVQFADWPALKPTMPYRTMPTLNVSGEIYAQSLAIQAFVARELGFYPTNNRDAMMVDQIAMAREDLLIAQAKFNTEQDPVKKAAANTVVQAAYPIYLGNFARYIRENPMNSGWVVGDKMSLGDIILYEGTQTLVQLQPTMLESYPELKALRAKVEMQDGIKQYLAARKFYPF